MEKKNYIVGIDVGTSNIVIVVGSKEEAGDVKVEAIVSKPARGVNAGVIDNYNEAGNVIREAKQEIEEELGIRITEAYAGLSGAFVRCDRYTDHVFVKEPREGVTQRDVENLAERMRNVIAPETETIIERIPQNYMVDGGQEIKSPVGTFGRQLSSTFNFILCDKTPLSRLEMTFRLLGIKLLGIFANALMMAPIQIASFFPANDFINGMNYILGMQNGWSLCVYVVLIILFTFFYTKMQIDPAKIAENLGKSGTYIPGIRPGNETKEYINKVLCRITVLGAIGLAFIAVLPHAIPLFTDLPSSMGIGGTGIIIVVGVALETVKQLEGQLTQKSYKRFFE